VAAILQGAATLGGYAKEEQPMTVLRCDVKNGVWWIAKQLEDGKKITPVEPTVVAFQGEDIRESPPFWQILPCPNCGVETDKNHDASKHIYAEFGADSSVVVLRKDVENERMETHPQAGGQERNGYLREGDERGREVFHKRQLVSLREGGDRREPERNGMVTCKLVPRWRRVIFLIDTLLDMLEHFTKRARRMRFRLLSDNKGS